METVKVNFDWDYPSTFENKGHNQSEWGIRKSDLTITAYKMRWE